MNFCECKTVLQPTIINKELVLFCNRCKRVKKASNKDHLIKSFERGNMIDIFGTLIKNVSYSAPVKREMLMCSKCKKETEHSIVILGENNPVILICDVCRKKEDGETS